MQDRPSNKLWQGRSSGDVDDIMIAMGESISLDIELYDEDIRGSMAHARMLHRIGLLSDGERDTILEALLQIRGEIETGTMEVRFDLEDIHTHVENRLIELIGDTGKKLHTARSRNDQVAVDTHLYVRRSSRELSLRLLELLEALLSRAGEEVETILPGYTHMQVAQPIRLSHHLLAHFWAFQRDLDRFGVAYRSGGRLPLGSGAMAGVNYQNDREFLREELDFREIYKNSMDAVSTRDHILDYLHACAGFFAHASRLADEIILWNSVEFAFISLPDSLTTGSSIMPQKKNPDLAELIRGKSGRVYAHYMNLLTNLKGLPFTYNRDLQEDRHPLLDAGKQTALALRALTAMVRKMEFKRENMRRSLEAGFATATDLADALVQSKGIPFREAHHIAGKLVAECARKGEFLGNASRETRASVHDTLLDDAFYGAAVDLASSADKKVSYGGTARSRQEEQLGEAKEMLEERKSSIEKLTP